MENLILAYETKVTFSNGKTHEYRTKSLTDHHRHFHKRKDVVYVMTCAIEKADWAFGSTMPVVLAITDHKKKRYQDFKPVNL